MVNYRKFVVNLHEIFLSLLILLIRENLLILLEFVV